MIANHDIIIRSIGILLITILNCIVLASLPPMIVGLFPTEIRYCGVSFAYNLCIAIYAGIAPIIMILGHKIGSLIPVTTIIMIIAAVTSIISILLSEAKHMSNPKI